MSVNSGFNEMQNNVNVDPEDLKKARERRDGFKSALGKQSDVVEIVVSGSLARGSHADPIHDVDLIIVYDGAQHPDWGVPGESAGGALSFLGSEVNRLLGVNNGTVDKTVRLASPRNHAVKCFLDDPEDPNAFTVDAMPALRLPSGLLLVPEKLSESWISTNPEHLIQLVKSRHAQWNQFVKLVRVLKRWNVENGKIMKSLLIEVLALDCLHENIHRGRALAGYFTAANVRLGLPVNDPADLCGPIQPDLDVEAARVLFQTAAGIAQSALDAEDRGDEDAAMCHWHELFGDVYPEPSGGCASMRTAAAAAASLGAVAAIRTGPRRVRDAPQG